MEADRDRITALMQDADYYRSAKNDPSSDQAKLEELEIEITSCYSRWERLETLAEV